MSEHTETFGLLGITVWDESPNSGRAGDPPCISQIYIPIADDTDESRDRLLESLREWAMLHAQNYADAVRGKVSTTTVASVAFRTPARRKPHTPRLVQPRKRA